MNIEQMAREALLESSGNLYDEPDSGEPYFVFRSSGLKRFAALVRAQALEEAAAVCDARFMGDLNREDQEARRCAGAIRALKSDSKPLGGEG